MEQSVLSSLPPFFPSLRPFPFLFCIAPLSIENVQSDTHSNVDRRAHFAYCLPLHSIRGNSGSRFLPSSLPPFLSSSSRRGIDGQTHAPLFPLSLSPRSPFLLSSASLNGARDRFIRLLCEFWPSSKLKDNGQASATKLQLLLQTDRHC